MLLTGRVAVIFGGDGATSSAVAQTMAHEGAHVCSGVRSQGKFDRTVSVIRMTGGTVETLITDVLDGHSVSKEITCLAQQAGGIDVVASTMGLMYEQGKHLDALSLSEFMSDITPFLSTQFNTAEAAAPYIDGNRAGVVLSVVVPAVPIVTSGHLGHIVSYTGTKAFIKALANGVGPANIRIVGARSHAIVNVVTASSCTGGIFSIKAQSMGLTVDQWLGGAVQSTMPTHLPILAQIAEAMTLLSSDHTSAMTVTVVDITGGATYS